MSVRSSPKTLPLAQSPVGVSEPSAATGSVRLVGAEPIETGWSTPELEVGFLRQALRSAAMGNDIIVRQLAGSDAPLDQWIVRQSIKNSDLALRSVARSLADLEGIPEGIDRVEPAPDGTTDTSGQNPASDATYQVRSEGQ